MSLKASETRRAERRRNAAEPHEEVVSTKRGNQPIGSMGRTVYLPTFTINFSAKCRLPSTSKIERLGVGFKKKYVSSLLGEMIKFD